MRAVTPHHWSAAHHPINPVHCFPFCMSDIRTQTINGLEVHIDRSLCIGSGNCVNLAPEVFTIRQDAIVDFKDEVDDSIDASRLVESCQICPVDALLVYDGDEQIVP